MSQHFPGKMANPLSKEDAAMAESSIILVNHEAAADFVDQLFMPEDTGEYRKANTLYDFCAATFPNCLTLMFLKVYRSSTKDLVRFRSIYMLSATLLKLKNRNFELSLIALYDIKPLLISCLTMQEATESDIQTLRIIVSFVAYNVVTLDNNGWDELSECILLILNCNPLKAFQIFLDLPPLYDDFIYRFLDKILHEAYSILKYPVKSRAKEWMLALQTVIKMGIQLLDSELRYSETRDIISMCVKSADSLVSKGMETFLQRGLKELEKFLAGDSKFVQYNTNQCEFVSEFALKISGIGTLSKEIAQKISLISKLRSDGNDPAAPLQSLKNQDHGARFDQAWFDHLQTLSPLEILRDVVSNERAVTSRELAYRRLIVLLSDHTLRKVKIEPSMFRELQILVIFCLSNEEISENIFKILGQVVYHVATELFEVQDAPWDELREYIITHSKTEFNRVVYILQCLTMSLDLEEFRSPLVDNLLPEIMTRLDPPQELLVDNSCWVLMFTGAFCAAVLMTQDDELFGHVREIAYKMIDSVRKLVGRGMEVGIVTRAFRDLETFVKKQCKWYTVIEYRFFKGLISKLYIIKGMSMESKIILWRINITVEKVMGDNGRNRSLIGCTDLWSFME